MANTVHYYYSDKNAKDQKQIVRILRNMADALESNAVPDLDTDANNPIGELSVDLMGEVGQAWRGEPDSWAVFEAWVHFSAGPNAIVTEKEAS